MADVRAERKVGSEEGVQWLVHERPDVTLQRQFALTEGIDVDGIVADYRNGVLSVQLPVSEQATARRIEVARTAKSIEMESSKSDESQSPEHAEQTDLVGAEDSTGA